MNKEQRYVRLPLTTLIEILEGKGFRIDIDLRLKLQQILISFQEEIPIGDLDQLKSYIRPLIAKSHNQQLIFDTAFEKYAQFIQTKSEALENRLLDHGLKQQIVATSRVAFGEYRTALLLILGTLAFLLFAYVMNLKRDLPTINLSEAKPPWVAVGDSLVVEGQVTGMFVNASIHIADSLIKSDHFYNPKNDIIRITKKFEIPGTYEIKLRAHNILTERDTSQSRYIEVCANKPKIDFQYKIDSENPLKVTFLPEIANTSGEIYVSMKTNGQPIERKKLLVDTDSLLVYEFADADTYDIELSVLQGSVPSDGLCDFASIRKVISLNSVILGNKKPLVRIDPYTAMADTLLITKDSTILKVGIISYKDSVALRKTYGAVFDSLTEKIKQYNEVDLSFLEEKELSVLLLQGDIDIGVYTVFPYLEAANRNPELKVFATHQIAGKPSYEAYIITNNSDGYDSISDLVDKRFTFVKPTSTSGYKLPKGIFEIGGNTIANKFVEINFSGSHEKSIEKLRKGETDGIAIDEDRWRQAGRDTTNLQIIHKHPVPYNAYVLSPKLSLKERGLIETVLVNSIAIKEDNPLGIEKVVRTNDSIYNELRRYLKMPRRKPGLIIDSILIDSTIAKKDTALRHFLIDSINSLVKKSNRFSHKANTLYNYKANLNLKESQEGIVRYYVELNSDFIGTGEISVGDMADLPGLFVDCILNALPIQATLIKGDTIKNLFVPYGKKDGINLDDYVFALVHGDTLKKNEIRQYDSTNTYFPGLSFNRLNDTVKIWHPSPSTVITQYFDVFNVDSWVRSSTNDLAKLLGSIGLFLILPLVCIEFFYFRNRKIAASKEMVSSLKFEGIKPPYDLELPNQNDNIRPEKELYLLSRMLKHRREAGISKIDIFKSIGETAQNAGFVNLFFKETTKVSEYLVIVDHSNAEGFHSELFGYLTQFLKNEDTLLDVFYFNHTLRHLNSPKYPDGISLESLSEKYPDHILLIISRGDKLINFKTERMFRWASDGLTKWKTRFILTPKSFSEWDRAEDLIDRFVPVFPATLKGLLYLSSSLNEKQLPDFQKRISDLQLSGGISFYSQNSVKGIKEFLKDPLLFQWFCCLAIYPKMHWPFAIAIGKALIGQFSMDESELHLNFESLYKISEVNHLLESAMDDDLRVALMKSLDPKVERVARKAILNLLNKIKVPEDSYAYREAMVQAKVNHSLLHLGDKQATKDLLYLWENKLIEDRATKSYLGESTENLWNKKAEDHFSAVDSRNWKHLLFPRGPIYIAAAMLVLTLLNLTLFQNIIEPIKPEFAKKVQPIDNIAEPIVSYAAILNNQAVDLYYNDNANDSSRVDSLLRDALIRNDSLIEVQRNLNKIEFNEAMEAYLSEDFGGTIRTLSLLIKPMDTKDSLYLESLHYLGLSEYYLNNYPKAKYYLNKLKDLDPSFLVHTNPNLDILLFKRGDPFKTIGTFGDAKKPYARQLKKNSLIKKPFLALELPFNENADDISGNGNDGTVMGGTSLTNDRFGNANSAYRFGGVKSDIIKVSDDNSLDITTNLTISAWIMPTSFSEENKIITKFPSDSYQLSLKNGRPSFQISSGGSYSWQVCDSPRPVELNQWSLVVGIYDFDNQVLKVYINNELVKSTRFKGTINSGGADVIIGNWNNGHQPFYGIIDDVRIHYLAISDKEINAIYRENGWKGSLSNLNSRVSYPQGTNVVTLNVNTNDINGDNVLDECFFTWEDPDGNFTTSGTGPELEDWLITIDLNSDIEWRGISSSSEDKKVVNIIQIKRKSGTPIFKNNSLKGDGNPKGGKVRGKPQKITNDDEGGYYKYNIQFKVKGVGGIFNIDPKIKVE